MWIRGDEGEYAHTRSQRERNGASGNSGCLPKFSTLNNAQLPWDHTPPPILIGHLLRPRNSFPYSIGWFTPTHCMLYACFRDPIYDATATNPIGRLHAHSLYALCMFQGSYPWRNCHEFINRFHAHSLYPRSRWPPPGVLIFPDMFFKQGPAVCSFDPALKIGTGCIFQNSCYCHSVTSHPTENIIDCIIFFRAWLDCYITNGVHLQVYTYIFV